MTQPAPGSTPAQPPHPPDRDVSPDSWPPGGPPSGAWSTPAGYGQPAGAAAGPGGGAWIAGLVLIAIGGLLLLGRWSADAGEYIVLAVGIVLLVVFLVTREYGALIPAGIVTGVGAGIPLTTAYPGELGGGLFLMALAGGFLLIWVVGLLFRVPENHWWPLIPGLIVGSIGAAMSAGERGHGIADVISTGWPILLVVAGLLLLAQTVRARSR
jgi:hypothetical protein